jgi:hypothetical protein
MAIREVNVQTGEVTERERTPEEIAAEQQWQAADAALIPYTIKRRNEYPSIGDQLDALFKAGVFPEDMAAQIQSVKDKHPKPQA